MYIRCVMYIRVCVELCIYMHSVGAGGRLFEPNQAVARWARRAEDVPLLAFLFQNKNWKSDFKTSGDYHGIVVTLWAELSW